MHANLEQTRTNNGSSCPTDPSPPLARAQLDPTIYEALQKNKVQVGDVIYIEANSGAVSRAGRSDAFAAEYDLEAEVRQLRRHLGTFLTLFSALCHPTRAVTLCE